MIIESNATLDSCIAFTEVASRSQAIISLVGAGTSHHEPFILDQSSQTCYPPPSFLPSHSHPQRISPHLSLLFPPQDSAQALLHLRQTVDQQRVQAAPSTSPPISKHKTPLFPSQRAPPHACSPPPLSFLSSMPSATPPPSPPSANSRCARSCLPPLFVPQKASRRSPCQSAAHISRPFLNPALLKFDPGKRAGASAAADAGARPCPTPHLRV